MPFEIVRNDITNMQVDVIVNPANPMAKVGRGVDSAIHEKAGPELYIARKSVGDIPVGQAAITPAFYLDAKYVIHAIGPLWINGNKHEEFLLRQCYDHCLQLALEHHCKSIAFPLISGGNRGFPKKTVLKIAINAISDFLMDHDMQIYLVVFNKDSLELSENLFHDVAAYIDENYIFNKQLEEYAGIHRDSIPWADEDCLQEELTKALQFQKEAAYLDEYEANLLVIPQAPAAPAKSAEVKYSVCDMDFNQLLAETDAGFSETLLKLIDRSGKTDSEIYKKAYISHKLFSKIKNNPDYKPSKNTAIAFAMALELSLEETKDFIGRAGFTLSRSQKQDLIVEYFIKAKNYDIIDLNIVLFKYDLPLIGSF